MTSFSKQKILEKLESFKEYLDYLYQLREETENEKIFLSDFHLFGNVERYLQLSIQAIMDISHLVIIDLELNRPEDTYLELRNDRQKEKIRCLSKKSFCNSRYNRKKKCIFLRKGYNKNI